MAIRTKVKMPKLGDTVDEVLVVEMLVTLSDTVDVGDPLMIVETDKVDAEVPSPVAGEIKEILVAVQDEVAVGAVIAVIEAG